MKAREVVARFLRRGRSYAALMLWLLTLVYRGRFIPLAAAVALGGGWMVSQAAALGLVYGYANVLQQSGIFSIRDIGIDLRSNVWALLAVVAAAGILMAASSLCLYGARLVVTRATGLAYRDMLYNITRNYWRLPDPRAPGASRTAFESGLTSFFAGARLTTSSAALVGSSLPSMIGSVLAAGVLFLIDWKLTALLAASVVIQAAAVYLPTLRAASMGRNQITKRKAHNQALLAVRRGEPAPDTPEFHEAIVGMSLLFAEGRTSRRLIRLSSQLASTVVLALAITYIAASLMSALHEWPKYLAYIGALRIVLNGVTRTTTVVAGMSRFYKRIWDFRSFNAELAQLDSRTLNGVDAKRAILVAPSLTTTIPAGARVAVGVNGDHRDVLFTLIGAAQKGNSDLEAGLIRRIEAPAAPSKLTVHYRTELIDAEDAGRDWLDAADSACATVFVLYDGRAGQTAVPTFDEDFILIIDEGEATMLAAAGTPEWAGAVEALVLKMRQPRRQRGSQGDEDDEDEEEDDEDI